MLDIDEKIVFQQKKIDLLTVGEILIDMIAADYDNHETIHTYQAFFGGSPSNIAMNVKKLGLASAVIAAVGKDRFGTFLLQHLHEAKMDTNIIQQVDYSTSLVVVTKSKATPEPVFYRDADFHLDYTPELEHSLLESKIVHFSCWPISKNPARQVIEKVIDKAKNNQILICFDPNYHPAIWNKGDDGVAYVKSIISKVDIIKPSRDDAERIFGKDTDENQLQKFLTLGPKLVIMTLGSDGAIVSNGVETVKFPTLAKDVVDSTGAGDAFWSGFYAGLVKGYTIREALYFGFAVSAYKLQFTGAVVPLPKLEEIKAMYHL